MLKNFFTREITTPLSDDKFSDLFNLIKNENSDSILASLNKKLIKNYLDICIKSNDLFFFSAEINEKIIGYAIVARKPHFLINEFRSIKYLIIFNLLFNFRLKTILNVFLSLTNVDLALITKEKKNIIKNSFNLNLLAIDNNLQSKGIGKNFLNDIFSYIKKKSDIKTITVETFNDRAASFYENKINFKYLGVKLRLFKNLKIYKKEDF